MRSDAELTRRGIQRLGTIGLAVSRLVDLDAMCRYLLTRLREDRYFMLPEGYSLPLTLDYPYVVAAQWVYRAKRLLKRISP
jgi:hypothetical protein